MNSRLGVVVFALASMSACASGRAAPTDLGAQNPDDVPRPTLIGVVEQSVLEPTGVTPVPYTGEFRVSDGTVVVIDEETTRVWECTLNEFISVDESRSVPDPVGCLALVELGSEGTALQIRYLDPVPGAERRWHLVGTPSAIGTTSLVLADVFVGTATAFDLETGDDALRPAVLSYEGECAEGAGLADMVFEVNELGEITAFVGYGDARSPFDDPCAYVV